MKIDIYKKGNRYTAVRHGAPAPTNGGSYFKTIDLKPGERRTGAPDAQTVIDAIERDGWADMGVVEVQVKES